MRPATREDNAQQPRRPLDSSRPTSRRSGPGAWSRLKPAPHDPLQVYGLPSKGETRLNDFKTQEAFYGRIVERYLKFCAASNSGADLDKLFSSLSLNTSKWALPQRLPSADRTTSSDPQASPPKDASSTPTSVGITEPSPELHAIHAAMRKLREAIVATRRRDSFAQRAEVFIIRAAILTKSWESYHPALLHLLTNIHPHLPLPTPELEEFVNYHILDLACRQRDFFAAYRVKLAYSVSDGTIASILSSLVQDNWVMFWQMQRSVDGYLRALMSHAEDEVRLHALKCLGRTYFTAEKTFVEKNTGKLWADLAKGGVGWELGPGNTVVIRRPKGQ